MVGDVPGHAIDAALQAAARGHDHRPVAEPEPAAAAAVHGQRAGTQGMELARGTGVAVARRRSRTAGEAWASRPTPGTHQQHLEAAREAVPGLADAGVPPRRRAPPSSAATPAAGAGRHGRSSGRRKGFRHADPLPLRPMPAVPHARRQRVGGQIR